MSARPYGSLSDSGSLGYLAHRARHIGELKSGGALHFSQYEQMIQAAISGQGLALGRQLLVGDLIASGALVAPFKQTLVGSRAHFIIESRLSAGKPQVREFAQWLLAETRAADGAS